MSDGPHLACDRDIAEYGTSVAQVMSHLIAAAKANNPDTYKLLQRAIRSGARLTLSTSWTDAIADTVLIVDVEGRQELVGRLQAWPVR